MNVRITQIDGTLPNLALMRIAAHHRARCDQVHFTRGVRREMFEPKYGAVYGSAIFKFSADRIARFRTEFPGAIVGGTGTDNPATVEAAIGDPRAPHPFIQPAADLRHDWIKLGRSPEELGL